MVEDRVSSRFAMHAQSETVLTSKDCQTATVTLCHYDRGIRDGIGMDGQLDRTRIVELTTEIVAGYVSNHKIGVSDLSTVINVVAIVMVAGREWWGRRCVLGGMAAPGVLGCPRLSS